MRDCRSCGARLFEGSTFCARCLTPIEPSDAEVQQGLVDVATAGGAWVERKPPTAPWNADPRYTEPLPPKEHSRWKASPQSFSGPVKVLLTAVILFGVPFLFYVIGGSFWFYPALVWWIAIVPRAFPDLWKRRRVR